MSGLPFWPAQASAYGSDVDRLVLALSVLIILLSAPVFILMTAFAVKYRRGRTANRKHPVNQRVGFEISWAVVPFLLLLVFYVWSTRLYFDIHEPPAGALEVQVVAKQWMWKFQHVGGQREINELHVPINRPVKLTMASQDVIHSLFIPALRLKQDVVPGRYTSLWFTADKAGTYPIRCSQFCGTDHSLMGGSLYVLSAKDYARWLDKAGVDESLAAQGADLFRSRGCSGCHGPSSTVHAPHLEGLFGKEVPLQDGRVVVADEQYVRDSILLPHSQVAAGYPDIMPTFQNVLSEADVLKLVAYIKSLGGEPREAPR
jgi:cytochrome c oxidase subunit 2